MKKGAEFSKCRTYRFLLWRSWNKELPYLNVIGLNPSKADENEDDPTIRKCMKFAHSWGYGGLMVTNLFAYCATKPEEMMHADDPIGWGNDMWIKSVHKKCALTLAAWGADGTHWGRDAEVKKIVSSLSCLALTKDGQPRHPLYMRDSSRPQHFHGAPKTAPRRGSEIVLRLFVEDDL